MNNWAHKLSRNVLSRIRKPFTNRLPLEQKSSSNHNYRHLAASDRMEVLDAIF